MPDGLVRVVGLKLSERWLVPGACSASDAASHAELSSRTSAMLILARLQ